MILILVGALLFAGVTWWRFSYGLFLFAALLPTYVIRFSVGPLPSTFLEVITIILCGVWLIKNTSLAVNEIRNFVQKNKILSVGILLFLIGATISIFTAVDTRKALGEWKAFYVEPTIVFFILLSVLKDKKNLQALMHGLLACGIATSALAVYQHFTGWLVPHSFWANRNTYRVTAWYGYPNAVGLFLTPLIPIAAYIAIDSWKKMNRNIDSISVSFFLSILFIPLSLLAIIFAKSTGALVAIVGTIGCALLWWKKTRWYAVAIGMLGFTALVLLQSTNPIKQELLFQDRSGQIRVAIYKETTEFLKDNPVFGAGLSSYNKRIVPYHTTVNGEGIEIFHLPHNIVLSMWVSIGLIGLIGFVVIVCAGFARGYQTKNVMAYFVCGALFALVMTGLVDSPYIKNDLSILFWIIIALLTSYPYGKLENKTA